jgi:hypothetical protein
MIFDDCRPTDAGRSPVRRRKRAALRTALQVPSNAGSAGRVAGEADATLNDGGGARKRAIFFGL